MYTLRFQTVSGYSMLLLAKQSEHLERSYAKFMTMSEIGNVFERRSPFNGAALPEVAAATGVPSP
jgi:hypothetical protein